MPRYIAFLRGINLGNRRLPMSRLKVLFEELDFSAVETFIASGNILFSTKSTDNRPTGIAHRQASAKFARLRGGHVRAHGGSSRGCRKCEGLPEEGQPGITIHIAFMQQELPAEIARKLASVRTTDDEIRVHGRSITGCAGFGPPNPRSGPCRRSGRSVYPPPPCAT